MDIKLPQLCTIKADCVSVAAEKCGEDVVTLLLMTPEYVIAIEGTTPQLDALIERAHAVVQALPMDGCAHCGAVIDDAVNADQTTDGRALCPDCANPDGDPETDEIAPACTGFPGACGADKGQPCKPGCPSLATDEYTKAFAAQS